MSDEPRKPLIPLAEEERVRRLRARGLDDTMVPLTLTPEEWKAAQNPGLPDKRYSLMTSGFKTSEFWISILAKMALVVLGYLAVSGGPLETIAKSVAEGGGFAGIVAPLAKEAVLGLIAFLIQKLSVNYGDNRTSLKHAALASEQ